MKKLASSSFFILVLLTSASFAQAGTRALSPEPWNQYDRSQIQEELDRWEKLRSIPSRAREEAPSATEEELPELETVSQAQSIHLDVFKAPVGFDVAMEFAVLSINGIKQEAYVISSAGVGHVTPENTYSLKLERKLLGPDGKLVKTPEGKPFPWHVSNVYFSTMYWGLQWSGAYWIHSTRDYDELGQPRSHGCIRFTFPAAMEIWDRVANQPISKASITTHGSNSEGARIAWKKLGLNAQWVNERVTRDLLDAHAETKGKYTGDGHPRAKQAEWFPKCGDADCFEYFKHERAK